MPLNGNKALDLDGLARFKQDLDAYLIGPFSISAFDKVIVDVYSEKSHGFGSFVIDNDVWGSLSVQFEPVSRNVAFTVEGSEGTLSYWLTANTTTYNPDTGNNFLVTSGYVDESVKQIRSYVDAKTWDASDITSGTLPISRGGTGMTTEPSIVVNLSSNTGVSTFGNPSMPGVMNTLNVRNGGTGKTSFTANRVLTSGTSSTGALQASAITTTELGYLDGVTSKIQTQLDGKASASHTHNVPEIQGLVQTNAYANNATVRSPVYFQVRDSDIGFYIMAGRTSVSSGTSPRTVNITLPISMKHIYAPVINEGSGRGSSGTQYYNAFKAGNGSGVGSGSSTVSSFSIQVGVDEACYVNWMVLGDTR